ncbi:MAG: hypothetical protein CMC88_06930 [Flavobacteriaceae bacterium]|nr:hypothetical protein [Flavobacteriaceae bacterium]|tara:strand:- start:22185 stop:22409 length:225 start_codon:yes stop_codon:yes gene_type:complete
MNVPKFLLSSNSDLPEKLFVLHTEYPRYILNIINDEIFWLEEFDENDLKEIKNQTQTLINQALDFYDNEIDKLK